MAILIVLVFGGFLAMLLLFSVVARIVQVFGLIAVFILGGAVMVVGYISLFVAGISAALLFQVWGAGNAGWAIFVAGLIGLTVASLLLGAIFNEIKGFSVRLKHWLGRGKTMENEKCTPSVSR
jgi:hypothetical protein